MENGAESYRRFLAGEQAGLVELIAAYYDGLVLFLLPLAGDADTAQDLAEDTFLRLCMKKPRYKDAASFKTWLYAIARNLALDRLRKNKRIELHPSPESLRGSAESDPVAAAYLKNEDKRAVHRALRSLKPEYAEILYLTYFEEMSNREAARVLKKSVHAVENLNYRARLALKAQLEKEGFVYEDL